MLAPASLVIMAETASKGGGPSGGFYGFPAVVLQGKGIMAQFLHKMLLTESR